MRKTFARPMALCVVLLTFALALWQSPQRSVFAQQTTSWSQPERISQTTNNAWFPDVVADQTGQVHVVWSTHDDGYDSVFYRSMLPDQRWTAQTDVFAEYVLERQLQEATRPALALDGKGNLLLTNRVESIYFSKAPATLAGNVTAWTEPFELSTDSVNYFSRIAVDSKDRYHAFLTQNVSTAACPICMHLFYRRSEDGGKTWTTIQDISMDMNGVAKPQAVIDAKDRLHVIWESGASGGTLGNVSPPISVYYATSGDGGNTWSTPLALGRGSREEQFRFPAIGIDGSGNVVVVWLKEPEDAVYFQISQDAGVSWSAPTRIAGLYGALSVRENRLDSFSMAADSGGNLHLAMVGRVAPEQTQIGVYHIAWNGQSWLQPDVILAPGVDGPVWPRITVGLGNRLHVVYALNSTASMGYNDGDAGARLDIYYARGLAQAPLNAPAVAPVAYPTLTPSPAPTAQALSQSIDPTAPAIANRDPGGIEYQNLRTEVDDYAMFLLSGLPVALIFIAGYLILRRRRA